MLEPEQETAKNGNPHNPSDNGASWTVDSNGILPESGDMGGSGAAETEPAIPIDWNQDPSETKQNPEAMPRTSETPIVSGKEDNPHESSQPSRTEPGEETQDPEETGGEIVIPILPPDIFP